MTTTEQKIEALKRELKFIGREVQRIEVDNSDGFESVDAIAQAVETALTAIFEIELEGYPSTEDELIAA